MTTDPRIRFRADLPEEARAAIEPYLAKWAVLIPGWCHGVDIHWDDEDTEGGLRVSTHYEYREADIYVLPNFLSNTEHRERHVVHELVHLSLAPLTKVAQAMRDALVRKSPVLEEWANEQLRHGEEATTCDLTEMVLRRVA
jgi:hypothetical protein